MTKRSLLLLAALAAVGGVATAATIGLTGGAAPAVADPIVTGSTRLDEARRRVIEAGHGAIVSARRHGDVILVAARAPSGENRLLVLSADDFSFVGETPRRAAAEPSADDEIIVD
jgi:hypothetical protein